MKTKVWGQKGVDDWKDESDLWGLMQFKMIALESSTVSRVTLINKHKHKTCFKELSITILRINISFYKH